MRFVILPVMILVVAAGCAETRLNVLEQELAEYKLGSEETRRNDLEQAYRDEKEKSEELVEKITEARAKRRLLTADLAQHQTGLSKLQGQIASLTKRLKVLEAEKAKTAAAIKKLESPPKR